MKGGGLTPEYDTCLQKEFYKGREGYSLLGSFLTLFGAKTPVVALIGEIFS